MRNLRLIVAYEGTRYAGWQIQPNAPTVQGAIETVLHQITQAPCRLRAAGRTDAGVHALGQVANFHTMTTISCEQLQRGLNGLLPSDVRIVSVDEVSLEFDARRDNAGKHYRYRIWNERIGAPHYRETTYHIRSRLDLATMVRAAQCFVGTHDFAAFRAADCERETTVRTLFRCSVSRHESLVAIDVEGTAFLKQMVRIIVGTLIEIALGRFPEERVVQLLHRGDRTHAGKTAPAQGLCLVAVL